MTDKNRTQRVAIRLSEPMYARLSEWSELMGLTPATLAAVAVGEYINTKDSQRQTSQKTAAVMAHQMSKSASEVFNDPAKMAALSAAMGAVEEQLGLDGLGDEK